MRRLLAALPLLVIVSAWSDEVGPGQPFPSANELAANDSLPDPFQFEYDSFAGKMNRLPVDRHFLGAVIAPRAYLGIMGAEKPSFNQGHVEAYDALIPVYRWLGAERNVGLYDHAPREHGVTLEDLHIVLDFADMVLFGKEVANEADFYRKNSGPVRYGEDDIDSTKGWQLPPPLAKQ